MEVAELIKPNQIVLGLRVEDKAQLLGTLADYASRWIGLPVDTILRPLTAREALGSTGIGQGIALPHASIPGLKQTFGCFAQLEAPIAFESVDGEPVDLAFLLLTPAGAPNQNVAALAAVSRRLHDRTILHDLRTSKSAQEVHNRLVGRR
jgi:PTS system nitrogen regulatory IIA component